MPPMTRSELMEFRLAAAIYVSAYLFIFGALAHAFLSTREVKVASGDSLHITAGGTHDNGH